MIKIAFVCHGNICRSPMAEFVFKNIINNGGVGKNFFIASRATSDEEIWQGVGNTIHKGTLEIFQKYSIPFDRSKRAVQLKADDYQDYDLFIGMDLANIRNMHRIFGSDPQNKVRLLLDYAKEHREVADPWYTGDFEKTYRDILIGCQGLLATLGEGK